MNASRCAAALAVLAVGACTDPGLTGVGGVRSVSQSEVAACSFVTNLRARPPVYGALLAQQGLEYARNRVLDSARADGANAVVFAEVEPGAPVFEVVASAWRC